MKISTLLDAIKTELAGAKTLSDVRDLDVSPGRFNADEITRRSFKAPALRVAFLGAPRTQPKADDTRSYDAAFAVFVLTDGKGRANEGIDLTQAVAEEIEVNRFSDGFGVGLPTNLRMDALYSGDVDEMGISLYSVSWTQRLRLGISQGLATPDDLNATIPEDVETNQEIDITILPGAV